MITLEFTIYDVGVLIIFCGILVLIKYIEYTTDKKYKKFEEQFRKDDEDNDDEWEDDNMKKEEILKDFELLITAEIDLLSNIILPELAKLTNTKEEYDEILDKIKDYNALLYIMAEEYDFPPFLTFDKDYFKLIINEYKKECKSLQEM